MRALDRQRRAAHVAREVAEAGFIGNGMRDAHARQQLPECPRVVTAEIPADVDDRRHADLAANALAAPADGQRRQRAQQHGDDEIMQGHSKSQSVLAQRRHFCRSETDERVGVARIIGVAIARPEGSLGFAYLRRHRDRRAHEPTAVASHQCRIGGRIKRLQRSGRRASGRHAADSRDDRTQQRRNRIAAGDEVVIGDAQQETGRHRNGEIPQRNAKFERAIQLARNFVGEGAIGVALRGDDVEIGLARFIAIHIPLALRVERECTDAVRVDRLADAATHVIRIERVRDMHDVDCVVRMEFAPAQHHALEEVELARIGLRSRHCQEGSACSRRALHLQEGAGTTLIGGPTCAARNGPYSGSSAHSPRRARRAGIAPRCAP